jgi:glycosyltransferase 2 family protein
MFAGAAVLGFVGGVDFADLKDDLEGAAWGWIIAAAIVAQLPRVTQAISTLGATPVQLPFGPVYGLQLAMSYMNLALPSSIARLAVSVRFFQRVGVAPAIAVTSGAIDSFTNTIVQVVLLVLLLIFSSSTINLDLGEPSSPDVSHLLFVLLGLALLVIVGVLLSPPGKRAIASTRKRIAVWWPQVRGTLSSLRGSHKLAELILGNIATEILFATALGMFARGLGYPLSLADLLVINLSVALFSMFIPVPGGIGVVEGGLLVGLTAAGMPESAAFATIILYRITTFYLPPIWGWFALNWLRKNSYL